jgi:hypothetical protein
MEALLFAFPLCSLNKRKGRKRKGPEAYLGLTWSRPSPSPQSSPPAPPSVSSPPWTEGRRAIAVRHADGAGGRGDKARSEPLPLVASSILPSLPHSRARRSPLLLCRTRSPPHLRQTRGHRRPSAPPPCPEGPPGSTPSPGGLSWSGEAV